MTIPLIGLGTWRLWEKECTDVVKQALEIGYRHIDTADVYENHQAIAKGMKSWPREQIFLTTKIGMNDLTPERIRAAVPRFLKELKTDYVDLLLIHWPNPDLDMVTALKTMHELQNAGLTRHIGVSNFVRLHLKQLAPYHFPILTNQIELHPYLQRKLLVKAYQKASIGITAYRPLAKGAFEEDPVLQEIGKKYRKTPSQIVLRWIVQQGIATIPKASTLQHLRNNFEIFDFELSSKEMERIDALDSGKRFCAPENFPVYED